MRNCSVDKMYEVGQTASVYGSAVTTFVDQLEQLN